VNRRKTGFTIVELLTSLTIIAILVALLIPALKMVRNMAKETAQKAQFATIDMALMAFKNDYGDYPPSYWPIPPASGSDYCGAQKLVEALLGWDLLGFHPQSAWMANGFDSAGGNSTYDPLNNRAGASLNERRGPYLELATTNAFRVGVSAAGKEDGLFQTPAPLAANTFVICDVFVVKRITLASGKTVKAGTPILYFKANTNSKTIQADEYYARIYNIYDNLGLIGLGKMTDITISHPLSDELEKLYDFDYNGGIRDPKASTATRPWPCRPDSYILTSAGADGLYGTGDDIHNF
jgi:prepilin-type N-terminal cleavage/methylation domain-containing protein